MQDINWDQKMELCWVRLKEAVATRDFSYVQRNYWSLYHLYKQKEQFKKKELPVIDYE